MLGTYLRQLTIIMSESLINTNYQTHLSDESSDKDFPGISRAQLKDPFCKRASSIGMYSTRLRIEIGIGMHSVDVERINACRPRY